MLIGVPKEIKPSEKRVALTPGGVETLRHHGHEVIVETNAGIGSGFTNDDYIAAGAKIIDTAAEVYAQADMIMKVKEPIAPEYNLIRKGQTLFTYFHFAASRELTEAMVKSGATCIAYETVQKADGSLPLLIPMSEVAGRMASQDGRTWRVARRCSGHAASQRYCPWWWRCRYQCSQDRCRSRCPRNHV
jgi:alanine dehydrogenase